MKIIVFNFGRLKRRIVALFTVCAFLISGALAVSFIGSNIVEAVSTLPSDEDVGTVIIIDAGHGGEDPGAIGSGDVYEKDLNLEIALCIGALLTERGYTVILTRTEDKMLYSPEENIKGFRKLSDLKNRVRYTEEYPNSILVSVHMNSFGDARYSGLQVYFTEGNDESRRLAQSIQSTVHNELQTENNRTVKSGKNIYLLEKSASTSVLIECGFLSNKEECEKLSRKEYQKQLSFSIVCGIIEFMKK